MRSRFRTRAVFRSAQAALAIAAAFVNCGGNESKSLGPQIHLAADTDSAVTVTQRKVRIRATDTASDLWIGHLEIHTLRPCRITVAVNDEMKESSGTRHDLFFGDTSLSGYSMSVMYHDGEHFELSGEFSEGESRLFSYMGSGVPGLAALSRGLFHIYDSRQGQPELLRVVLAGGLEAAVFDKAGIFAMDDSTGALLSHDYASYYLSRVCPNRKERQAAL